MSDLPERTSSSPFGCKCPWCRQYMEKATVTLEALLDAWQHSHLTGLGNWLWRQRPFDEGLPVDCPECGKPTLVRFTEGHGGELEAIIAPTRTEADKKFEALHD